MSNLQIAIAQVTETDYDGVSETTKQVTSTIDSSPLQIRTIEEDTVTDTICKDNHRTTLTALGYVWGTES